MAIDTLQLSKELQHDFTSAQAETLARVPSQRVTEDLATKRDLKDVETALRSDIKDVETALRSDIKDVEIRLRSEIKELETSLRSEIKELETSLRGEIKDLKVDMVKWIVGALVINFFGVTGLMITLIKTVH